jgi:His/Glu/Gln/Arg/opine family amino acid ABC transporter permease subunit
MILDGFLGQLLLGVEMTVAVSLSAITVGLILGLIGAVGELSSYRVVYTSTRIFTSLIRGLPELLVLFAVYFGGTILLTNLFGRFTEVNAFMAGVVALGLIFGAYASQIFRGAFLILNTGQKESAKALGLSPWQILTKILLPQAWHHAWPGVGNLSVMTLKDSSLVALIGLAELANKSQIAANTTHKPFTFYLACALIYLVLTSIMQLLINFFRYRTKHYGY